MLHSQPRGTAQQVPNTNGAFFSGAAQFEAAGTIPANDEVNLALPIGNLEPNQVLIFKIILAVIHANEAAGINEYNGYMLVDSAGDVKEAPVDPLTGGQSNPNAEAAIDQNPPIAVEIENTDAVNACAYRVFVTWSALPSPYVIAP